MQKVALTYLLIFAALNFAFVMPSDPSGRAGVSSSMITWEQDEKLRWSDFKGKAKSWSGVSALTASAIEYSYDCYGGYLELNVKAIFIPDDLISSHVILHQRRWNHGRADGFIAVEEVHEGAWLDRG